MLVGEHRQRRNQRFVLIPDWNRRGCCLAHSCFVLDRLKAFGLSSCGNREVADGRVKKGLKVRRQPEAGKFPYEIEKRFLEGVEGQFAVTGETIGQAHDPVTVTVIQSLKCV